MSKKYLEKLEKHLWPGLFSKSCGITYYSLLKVKPNIDALLEMLLAALKYSKSSHDHNNLNLHFKQLRFNYNKQTKNKKKNTQH